jgi:hypothetical protein
MATRNVVIAFWMSIIIILCIGYFFNENSSLCIWRGGVEGSTCSLKEGFEDVPDLTPEERNILNVLREKEKKIMESQHTSSSSNPIQNIKKTNNPVNNYKKNMDTIKND